MKYLLVLSLFLSSVFSFAQNVPYITFEQLEKIIYKQDDTLRIVNFWATWCKPCIEELPELERINAEYKNQKVKVI